jgi:2-methylisocitrate lyase-like PEP mutase family enzyme
VTRADDFRALHAGPEPLRLANAWDPLSARVFALAGAPALGTSSFAVALAHGRADGQQAPWSEVRDALAEIVAAVDVPVTVDVEAGYEDVAGTVADVAARGAVGVNVEDQLPSDAGRLLAVDEQAERLAAVKAAAPEVFLNARCDAFFGVTVEGDPFDELLVRAAAYAEAGADGLFVPGLVDLEALRRLVGSTALPVNVMLWPGLPSVGDLRAAGVRRISQGGAAFLLAVAQLEAMTAAFLTGEPEAMGGELVPAFARIPELSRPEGAVIER